VRTFYIYYEAVAVQAIRFFLLLLTAVYSSGRTGAYSDTAGRYHTTSPGINDKRMKSLLFSVLIVSILLANTATAQVRTKGYYRKDGTNVRSYYRPASEVNSDLEDVNLNAGRIAKRNSSSYTDNYHKVYRGDHSNERYQNYNTLLRHNNYAGIAMGESGAITNNEGVTIGYLDYYEDGIFKILDSDSVHIGYVKLAADRKRVRVYDSYGYHVITKSIDRP
jgi:hypothetical protein